MVGMNMTDANTYIGMLIRDKAFLRSEYQKFLNNCYSVSEINGIISCDMLRNLLGTAKHCRMLREMLTDLLYYADGQSLSGSNLERILKLSSKYRNTYVSVLSHCALAFCQMQVLNRYPLSFEAFAWLFDTICKNDCFAESDMYQILSESRGATKYAIAQCIEYARKAYGTSAKLRVAESWVDTM